MKLKKKRSLLSRHPKPGSQPNALLAAFVLPGAMTIALLGYDEANAAAGATNAPIEEIEVTGQSLIRPLWQSTGNYSLIDAESIELNSPTHANELFKSIPGIWVSRGSGQESLLAIRSAVLTGPGACGAFQILENGIPIRPAGFCNINSLFETHFEQARAIELIRGPNSVISGGDGLNGLINIVTIPVPDSESTRYRFEGGSHDYYRLDLDQHQGSLTNQLLARKSHSFRQDEGYDQQKWLLGLSQKAGDWHAHHQASLTRLNQQTASYIVGEDSYQDLTQAESNPASGAYRDAWSLRWQSRFSHLANPASSLHITPYWRRSMMEFLMHYLPQTPVESNQQSSIGIDVKMRQSLTTHQQLDWLVRLESAKLAYRQWQDAPTQGPFPTGEHYRFDVFTRYVTSSIQWQSTHMNWIISSGFNVQYLHYDYRNHLPDGEIGLCDNSCRYTRPASDQHEFIDTAFKLGAAYQWLDSTEIFTSYNQGFRPPQASELFRLQSGQQQAHLDSERMQSCELGLRSQNPFHHSQIALFFQKKDNVILRDSNRVISDSGKTKGQGIEISSKLYPSPNHAFYISATYAKHQYDQTLNTLSGTIIAGDDMDTAPRKSANIRWQIQQDHWLSELEFDFMGSYFVDAEHSFSYPGHQLWHWRGETELTHQVRLVARINNLLDERFAERADVSFSGEPRYFPGASRSYFIGLQWTP